MSFLRARLAVLMFLLAALPARAQQPAAPPDFDVLLAQAMRLHQAGDLIGAIAAYRAALDVDPKRGDARSNLGAAYVRLGRFDEAIEQYKQALQSAPADPAIQFNLGLAYYKAAQIPDAVPLFESVVATAPDNQGAVLLLGDSLLQMGENQRVVDLLLPRAQAFSENLAFGYIVGTALLHLDRRDEAQTYLDRIFNAGESAESHLLLGTVLLRSKKFLEAIDELKRAVELNPQLPSVRASYAEALIGAGNSEAAIVELQRALRANPNDFEANLQLGMLRARDQQYDDALVYITRALKLRPRDRAARFNMANIQLSMGKAEEALVLLEPLIAEVPDYEVGHVTLARAYYRLKRKDDGDRESAIADRLRQQRQERELTTRPEGGTGPANPQSPESNQR